MNEVSQMEEIKFRLNEKKWLFNIVEPLFRKELIFKLSLITGIDFSSRSTTFLTAKIYRNVTLDSKEENFEKKPIIVPLRHDTLECQDNFWTQAINSLNKNVKVGALDSTWANTFEKALKIIHEHMPDAFEAVMNFVPFICTIKEAKFRSASHPHFFGVLFLRETNKEEDLAVSIIHELAHQELFLVNLIDRLVNQDSDYNKVHAPYQGTLRPPIGRLHSAHALFRMIQLEDKINYEKFLNHSDLLRKTKESFSSQELTGFAKEALLANY